MKILNKILALGICFILGGCMLFVAGMSGLDWDFEALDTLPITTQTINYNQAESQSIARVSIKNAKNIKIIPSEDELFQFSYHQNADYKVTQVINGDTLEITGARTHKFKINLVSFFDGLSLQFKTATLKVPVGSLQSLYIDVNNSNIEVNNLEIADITAKTDNGGIKLSNVRSSNISLSTENGVIRLLDVVADKIEADSDNGYIELKRTSTDWLDIESENGAVKLDHVVAKEAKIEVDNGSIEGNIDSMALTVEAENGRINLRLEGKKSDYKITVKVDNGSTNIKSANPDGATRQLIAKVDNGRIEIDFSHKEA